MSNMQIAAVRYIQQLPEKKLSSAVDHLRYLYELDALARRADEDTRLRRR